MIFNYIIKLSLYTHIINSLLPFLTPVHNIPLIWYSIRTELRGNHGNLKPYKLNHITTSLNSFSMISFILDLKYVVLFVNTSKDTQIIDLLVLLVFLGRISLTHFYCKWNENKYDTLYTSSLSTYYWMVYIVLIPV